jgi:hypothetical protein
LILLLDPAAIRFSNHTNPQTKGIPNETHYRSQTTSHGTYRHIVNAANPVGCRWRVLW